MSIQLAGWPVLRFSLSLSPPLFLLGNKPNLQTEQEEPAFLGGATAHIAGSSTGFFAAFSFLAPALANEDSKFVGSILPFCACVLELMAIGDILSHTQDPTGLYAWQYPSYWKRAQNILCFGEHVLTLHSFSLPLFLSHTYARAHVHPRTHRFNLGYLPGNCF